MLNVEPEYRRLFDVIKHSGEIVMWGEANSGILRCQPDSGYIFNMEIANSGGFKTIKRMRLMPKREVDFEPSIYDSEIRFTCFRVCVTFYFVNDL